MKYKQRQAQNQRILNISTTHLVVGIDIAQETHVARAVNYRGIELGRYLSFTNDGKGFEQLLRWVKNIQAQHSLDNIIIGMEPTGHYWLNLACWLVEKKIETVVVNPYGVKQNKEFRDNSQTKNDIVRWIDIYFPEYRNVFKDVTCQTSLSILRLYPLPK